MYPYNVPISVDTIRRRYPIKWTYQEGIEIAKIMLAANEPLEKIITQARTIENLHNLIKNNTNIK